VRDKRERLKDKREQPKRDPSKGETS
jgi:hypothetical protein